MRLRDQSTETTENVMQMLGTRLREARKWRDISQTDLAKRIGTSPNQVSMIESGKSGTSIRTMVAAASALNVSLDFLAGLVNDPRAARDLVHIVKTKHARILDLEGGRGDNPVYDDHAHIEFTDIRTAAGTGAVVHGEYVKSMIEFPLSWLRERGLQPGQCRVITVVGESMEPTITDGASILIDLQSRLRRNGRIYVIRIGNDELIMKRAVRDPEAGWLIVSDNPDKKTYPTQPWPDDASIVAEMKWHGQSFIERDDWPRSAG